MLYVSEYIRKKVIGLNDTSNELDDNTVIDVEPITGNTIRSRKRLQVNIQSPTKCTWCVAPPVTGSMFGNTNFTADTYFPLVKAGEYISISDDLASLLRTKLKEIHEAPKVGFYVGVSVGPAFVILGVFLVVFGCRKANTHTYYENINSR